MTSHILSKPTSEPDPHENETGTGTSDTSEVTRSTAVSRRGHIAQVIVQSYNRYAVVPILAAVLVIAGIEDDQFFTWDSIQLTLRQNASVGIIAVGLTFVLIGGGIDLSVGALYAGGAAVYTKVSIDHSLWLAFAIAVACGLVAGVVNGVLVTRFGFSALVATLGTASLFGGLVVVYAGNQAIIPENAGFGALGNDALGGIAYVVIVLVAVFVLGGLLLHRTAFGKSLFAIGGSYAASHLAGLRVAWCHMITYMISGVLAAVAGVIYASQTGIGESDLGGSFVALTTIAIVVLGGTSLFGGQGAMWRTAVGFAILATISTLFTVLAVSQATQDLIEGGIVVGALVLDAVARNRSVL